MKNNPAELKPVLLQCGRGEIATYKTQEVRAYSGNPLLEAMPPILSEDDAIDGLGYYPDYRREDRALPDHIRYHIIQDSLRMFVPLPRHIDVEQRFSRLLRGGYTGRNPTQAGHWPEMVKRAASVSSTVKAGPPPPTITDAGGMTMIGFSGLGKTTTVNRITNLYPQIIHHHEYHGLKFTLSQIVWLKLPTPFDGSIRGLCINFFQTVDNILGTHYEAGFVRNRGTVDELLPHMAKVAALHCIGVLIVDEIQHLNAAASGGAGKMLNFFVQLVNTINLPVILIGTNGAMRVLCGELRQIRRGCSQGDLLWEPMRNDEEWRLFLESIWRYQYTRHETELTRDLSDAIYQECQGITDFSLKVYFLAQVRAIATGVERITPGIVKSVCADSLRMARPVLEALRTNNIRILLSLSDVQPIDFDAVMKTLQTVPQSRKKPSVPPVPVIPDFPPSNNTGSPSELILAPEQPDAKKTMATKPEGAPGSLMEVVKQGQKKKLNSYDALKAAGLTRPPTEFFDPQATP